MIARKWKWQGLQRGASQSTKEAGSAPSRLTLTGFQRELLLLRKHLLLCLLVVSETRKE